MRLNILFILPSLRRGGAETQLITIANSLCPHQFYIHIACLDNDIHQLEKLSPNIKFHHFSRQRKFDKKTINLISKLIEAEDIDVVHCTLQIALFYGWAARLIAKRKPKLFVTVHTTVNVNFRAELFDWALYQWLMRQCNSIIFVCEEQKKYWEKKWRFIKSRGLTIYNGIDPAFFNKELHGDPAASFRTTHNIANDAKIIAHIAGFRPEKGHAILVDAFKQITISTPDSVLVFAGDGVLRLEIEALCRQKGIWDQVRFIGSVSDVRPLLANAYTAVIASTAVETFSIAMLEAMAMEVPLVATDIGGTREAVIPGETGWLVKPGDTNDLARAMTEALSSEDAHARMAKACREKVINYFTVEKMTAGYSSLFQKPHEEAILDKTAMDTSK